MQGKAKSLSSSLSSFVKRHPIQGLLIIIGIFLLVTVVADLRLILRLTSAEYYPVSSKILDRNNQLIYEIFTEKRRTPISITELPPYIKQATIAIEDKDFYKHFGFSPAGITRAIYSTIFKKQLQGGSTITQQLVKTALLTPERTLWRKFREFSLSLVVETVYSKDQILELYLNHVPYGGTAWGIEAASQTYFGKGAKDLTLSETALLAGLPAAPTKFSPFGANPNRAKERQKAVLRRMVEDKYITQDDADQAAGQELKFRVPGTGQTPVGLHFALWVKEQLVEEFGERLVEQGGLQVITTLDLDIQKEAEKQLKTEVEKLKKAKVGNGAALVIRPPTGEILAMVGSKDYFAQDEDGKVNVTLSPRQPGSAIKPLNYALGILNRKITAATVFNDIPSCFTVPGQPLYCPVNYDGTFHGPVQARFALGNSYNLPAVKMLALNSVGEFVPFAQKMGLTTLDNPTRYGLSLTLGGGEVKMTDMATAFGVFANQGIKQDLVAVKEVKNNQGKVLKRPPLGEGDRVLPIEVSFIISHILLDNNARTAAFGPSSFLNVLGHPEVSVKTGTTNDRRDNWTIGYTADVLVATWVGNNDNTPMSGAVSGVSGASPIWNKVIKFALDKVEEEEKHGHRWPLQPDGVKGANICALSGLSPLTTPSATPTSPAGTPEQPVTDVGCQTRFEYFLEDTVPQSPEVLKKAILIDKTTGQMASAQTPPENTEPQEHQILTDALGNDFCLDCPPPTEPIIINPTNIPAKITQ